MRCLLAQDTVSPARNGRGAKSVHLEARVHWQVGYLDAACCLWPLFHEGAPHSSILELRALRCAQAQADATLERLRIAWLKRRACGTRQDAESTTRLRAQPDSEAHCHAAAWLGGALAASLPVPVSDLKLPATRHRQDAAVSKCRPQQTCDHCGTGRRTPAPVAFRIPISPSMRCTLRRSAPSRTGCCEPGDSEPLSQWPGAPALPFKFKLRSQKGQTRISDDRQDTAKP